MPAAAFEASQQQLKSNPDWINLVSMPPFISMRSFTIHLIESSFGSPSFFQVQGLVVAVMINLCAGRTGMD